MMKCKNIEYLSVRGHGSEYIDDLIFFLHLYTIHQWCDFLAHVGLTVDAEVKRGKTIHVPDSVYKKGCIWGVKHGITVSQKRFKSVLKWLINPLISS